ncbi:hypothetical protein KCP74_20790 [Salmonella enterica subsp. enterica]|nr:hypothetical protein KCP74_20790 [Salmonella enterica subsp. enterica]
MLRPQLTDLGVIATRPSLSVMVAVTLSAGCCNSTPNGVVDVWPLLPRLYAEGDDCHGTP